VKVEATDAAEADLEEIAAWISRDNPGRGLTYIRELRSRCESLSVNPDSSWIAIAASRFGAPFTARISFSTR